jgi:uncharacterized membrane protein YczE
VWPVIFEFLSITFSVIFCAITIKLADDFLDQDIDINDYNFAKRLGNGSMLYGLLSMAFAVSLNPSLSITLFLSSYIIGMFHDLKHSFPSHLNGLQESILVLMIGIFFWGWEIMLFSLLFIFSIQLLDDYIDDYTDRLSGHRNWSHRLGRVECFLLFLLSMLAAWVTDERMFLPTFLATVVFYSTILYYQRRKL